MIGVGGVLAAQVAALMGADTLAAVEYLDGAGGDPHVNLGAEESFKLHGKQMLKARLDVVNLTDNSYELRDGSGVGVNAASYGARIGFFGSLTYVF